MNSQQRQRVVNLLTRARNLIQNNGWCANSYEREIGGTTHYCAIGALDEAGRNTAPGTYTTAYNLLSDAVGGSIVAFNDNVAGRANGDRRYVLRAYDRAIKLAAS